MKTLNRQVIYSNKFISSLFFFNIILCLRNANLQIRHVEKAYVHPYFSPEQSSDIALLKLDESLEFNDFVKVRFHRF